MGHPTTFEDFSIISLALFESELLLQESLLINTLKPTLNANVASTPLYLIVYINGSQPFASQGPFH